MKLFHVEEPELEFGGEQRHIDIRYGLTDHGPLDRDRTRGHSIDLGMVGDSASMEGLRHWLDRIDKGIESKDASRSSFFAPFPGFSGPSGAFGCNFRFDSRWQRALQARTMQGILSSQEDPVKRVHDFVDLIMDEISQIREEPTAPRVILIALPLEAESLYLAGTGRTEDPEDDAPSLTVSCGPLPDLHDLLKARAMQTQTVLQVVWPHTYDSSKRRRNKGRADRFKGTQDEATRAWNLTTALYYKAGGTPWRLIRRTTAFASLHVGVRFYKTLDGSALHTSLAQVFNERGDGTVVKGGAAMIDKEDRQPHMDAETAKELLEVALKSYRAVHRTLPARVVVHKSSTFNHNELEGFRAAAEAQRIDLLDLIAIGEAKARVHRPAENPPLRGTFLSLGSNHHVLYTKGSVEFYRMYPGMYIPRPLGLFMQDVSATPLEIAEEILALTKMNWNNTQFDRREPITLRAAHTVSNVLRYLDEDKYVEPSYRLYT